MFRLQTVVREPVDAVIAVTKGDYRKVKVHGPLMEETEASYGVFHGDSAIIEMAAASGLPMVPTEKRNPLNTTTYGTGELIKDALDHGYRKLSIAIGGSATNDGGMGAMSALGVRFLDAEGNVLTGVGSDLEKVADIDMSGLHPAVAEAEITVMCDVTNPLTGPDGSNLHLRQAEGRHSGDPGPSGGRHEEIRSTHAREGHGCRKPGGRRRGRRTGRSSVAVT